MAKADRGREDDGGPSLRADAAVSWPLAVTGAFLFAASGIALVTGVSLWTPGPQWNWLWRLNPAAGAAFAQSPRLAGAGLFVLCAMTVVAGFGLVRRKRWAWRVALFVFACNALGDAVEAVRTRQWLQPGAGILIAGLFLFFLARSRDRVH